MGIKECENNKIYTGMTSLESKGFDGRNTACIRPREIIPTKRSLFGKAVIEVDRI
jgi:hypothetical protein